MAQGRPYFAATRPWVLPFDLSLAEARAYSRQIGSPLAKLIELFAADETESRQRRENERLGLSMVTRALLLDDTAPNGEAAERTQRASMAWLGDPAQDGYDSSLTRFEAPRAFMKATGLSFPETMNLLDTYWVGRQTTAQSKISLEYADDAPCDLATASFVQSAGDTDTWRDRLGAVHRFVRLWRAMTASGDAALAFTIPELDEAIFRFTTSVPSYGIDDAVLAKLVELADLRARFSNIPVFELLSWWGDMDARPDAAQYVDDQWQPRETTYARLFARDADQLDPTIAGAFDLELQADGRFELAGRAADVPLYDPAASDQPHLAVVAAAIGSSNDALIALIEASRMQEIPATSRVALSLRNLSILYMRQSVSRALGMTPLQLIEWEQRTSISLTTTSGEVRASGAVPALAAAIARVTEAAFGLEALDFALDGALEATSRVTLLEAASQRLMLSSRLLVADVRANAPRDVVELPGAEPNYEKFTALLGQLAPEGSDLAASIDTAKLRTVVLADFDGAPADFNDEAEWKSWVDGELDARHGEIFRSTEEGAGGASLYSDHLGLDLGGGEVDVEARAARLISEILRYQLDRELADGLADLWASALRADAQLVRGYLGAFRGSSLFDACASLADSSEGQISEMTRMSEISDDFEFLEAIAAEASADQSSLHATLRASLPGWLAIQRLGIDAATLDWLYSEPAFIDPPAGLDHATRLSLPRPDLLGEGSVSLDELLRLAEFMQVGALVTADRSIWQRLLSESFRPGKTDATIIVQEDIKALADAAGWDAEITASLIAGTGVRPLDYAQLRSMTPLRSIAEAMSIQAAHRASFAMMADWATSNSDPSADGEVTRARATSIRLHAKSRYDDATWPKVAEPIRDELREQQRDALAAYVEDYYDHHDDLGYDLYSWLLIDVDMSACAPTSRIKACVGALQQLVQRWHLGLEDEQWANPSVQSDSQVEQWLWRGRYRVWEAQRKVYLHPENWLDSALRDDETPQFKEFRDTVLGDEIADANVEKALTRYVKQLDDIARLEVDGVYHELEHATGSLTVVRDVLHVFARTRGKSGVNYYRTRLGGDAGNGWTPWQKLPFEIEAKDVLPVVFNRRLMVIWPRFERRAVEVDPNQLSENDTPPPEEYLRATLAWSELHHGEWSEPRETEDYIDLLGSGKPSDEREVTLTYAFGRRDLRVYLRSSSFIDADAEIAYESWGHFEFGSCDGSVDAQFNHIRARRHRPSHASAERQGFVGRGSVYPMHEAGVADVRVMRSIDDSRFETLFERPYHVGAAGANKTFFYQDAYSTFAFTKPLYAGSGGPYSISNLARADTLGFLDESMQRSASLEFVEGSPLARRALDERYDGESFQHPYLCLLTQQLERHGPEGIYRPDPNSAVPEVRALVRQTNTREPFEGGDRNYIANNDAVATPYPRERFDFTHGAPYAVYNWELFHHIPVFIAEQLAAVGRFDEALKWFHYVFDPTQTDIGPAGQEVDHWRFGPFENSSTPIARLLELLTRDPTADAALFDEFTALTRSLTYAQRNPFNPFGAARIRTVPFQLSVVMKYLDTLIAWGDELFRKESIESVAEATQLYVIAQSLLGERPVELPARVADDTAYCGLGSTSLLNNAMFAIEDRLPPGPRLRWGSFPTPTEPIFGAQHIVPGTGTCGQDPDTLDDELIVRGGLIERPVTGLGEIGLNRLATPSPLTHRTVAVDGAPEESTLLFCIPANDKLLSYWDAIDDRLYKIRHCLNLAGQPRRIRLFEPPIDPAALISAVAGGADLSDAIDDLDAPPPHYRFSTHLSLAKSFAKDLEALGSDLLAALERQDAEELARLRSDHDLRLLDRVEDILQSRIEEARESRKALEASRKVVEQRHAFYRDRERVSTKESAQMGLINSTAPLHKIAAGLSIKAATAALVPDFNLGISGFAGSPVVEVQWGGSNLSKAFSAVASSLSSFAAVKSARAQTTGIEASHERRKQEWDHMEGQAEKDLLRIDAELVTAELRIEIAQREFDRHRQQRKNTREVATFLSTKFTNLELYDWMSRELSRIFRQTHQLAFDLAKRAERCFHAELPSERNRSFISYGSWDGRRKGLLSGQRLSAQLRELEAAYHTRNLTRDFSPPCKP